MSARAQPDVREVAAVLDGPHRDGCEQRWRVRLVDGRTAVLSELLPELARDEATRRRYVRDVERMRTLGASSVAALIAVGPAPEPRDPAAAPPWRLRVEPEGPLLEDWLRARAPAAFPEVTTLAVRLADALAEVHARGAVLRDLHPRKIVAGARVTFTDVGLARTDILSSRTAASLVLEGSPYAAPEHAARTTVDVRADVFTVGVILWRATTGTLPYGDGPAFLAEGRGLPDLVSLRPDVPPALAAVIVRCLAWAPDARPGSARELGAILRGEVDGTGTALVRSTCQVCGAALRGGLRMCLACGRVPVLFTPLATLEGCTVDLHEIKEDAAFVPALRTILDSIAARPVPHLRFVVGNTRMYSKRELESSLKLPIRVTGPIAPEAARELSRRIEAIGGKVKVRPRGEIERSKRFWQWTIAAAVTTLLASVTVLALSASHLPVLFIVLALLAGAIGIGRLIHVTGPEKWSPMLALRPAPAMVPPSDALTARLAAVVGTAAPADVREILADVALSVQAIVDLRAAGDSLALTLPTAERLVDLVCSEATALASTDVALATLDEGTLVRALAASEARKEPRAARVELLAALDRLRTLEDDRTRRVGRLLEAAGLLRRALAVALADPARVDAAEVALALTALDDRITARDPAETG